MKTQHTQTPWNADGVTIQAEDGYYVANTNPNGRIMGNGKHKPEDIANAALIVRAVNSHQDMVQFVRDFLEGNVSDSELVRRGHRIIAKAEGRE